MTEITLPWFILLAFFVATTMAAYHFGRASEQMRRRRHAASWEELWIKRSRAK